MKQLEELDPSSIDAIEFNIKNVKKYTSIITIFISICVIALSIALNIDSISQIWIPRSQLTISQYEFKDTTQPFTDQPICITYFAN